ncbi:DUF4264 domain-containing protein [Heliobacillus mobilis]|uniref:Putative gamma-glutamylcyclotransferase n=1 Tax=Heliobacterium mobile TaxID=28064 RepID=A0A6I3SGG8_HELMO|nr:DUF4264 family protein [Heliobacterium mobile]MTV47917.1 DUF4264 domain-containing protein [Heliobacterium mobile]
MDHALFVYGTLMDRETMEGLLDHSAGEPLPALLTGYKRYPSSYGYPFILPVQEAIVKGTLWSGLTDDDLQRIDEYEGLFDDVPMYYREKVTIRIDDQPSEAWVYIGNREVFADDISDPSKQVGSSERKECLFTVEPLPNIENLSNLNPFLQAEIASEPIAEETLTAHPDLYKLVDFLNSTLSERSLRFGLRENGDTMTISVFEI